MISFIETGLPLHQRKRNKIDKCQPDANFYFEFTSYQRLLVRVTYDIPPKNL